MTDLPTLVMNAIADVKAIVIAAVVALVMYMIAKRFLAGGLVGLLGGVLTGVFAYWAVQNVDTITELWNSTVDSWIG